MMLTHHDHHWTTDDMDKGPRDVVRLGPLVSFFSLLLFILLTVILDNTHVDNSVSPPLLLANAMWGGFLYLSFY